MLLQTWCSCFLKSCTKQTLTPSVTRSLSKRPLCREELIHVWLKCSAHRGRWEIVACITSSPCSCWTLEFNFTLTNAPTQCLLMSPASNPVFECCIFFPGLHKASLVCSKPLVLTYVMVSLAGSVTVAFFPLNTSICFLSTSARLPVSLVTLSFLFPHPVFSL